MMYGRLNIYAILVITLVAGLARSEVSTIQSDNSGAVFDFLLSDFKIESLRLHGQDFHRIGYTGGGYGSETGSPQIPRTVLTVGIPPTGNAAVAVTPSEIETRSGIRILPAPTFEDADGIPREVYTEGDSYQRSGYYPEKNWEVSEPLRIGPYRILRITLNPVQYDPATQELKIVRRMSVQVRFDRPVALSESHRKLVNEGFYRSAILNYDQARNWRDERRAVIQKKALYGSGPWYKIPITEEGLYKVTGSFLSDQGIDIGSIDPQTLKICNNGGRVLPENLSVPRPDALIENPVLLSGLSDGSFDASDYLLFYGQGVTGWEADTTARRFHHYINLYTDENVYWLTFNDGVQGQRISYAPALSEAGAEVLSSFQDLLFYEQDLFNTENGGRHWVGQSLTPDFSSQSYDFNLTDLDDHDPVEIMVEFFSHMLIRHTFSLYLNDNPVTTVTNNSYRYMDVSALTLTAGVSGRNTLTVDYSGSSPLSEAYVNWFEVVYSRDLALSDDRLRFYSPFPSGIYTYQLSGFSNETVVLDVTDPASIQRMRLQQAGGSHMFTAAVTDSFPRIYYAANSAAYRTPSGVEASEWAGLRNPSNAADLVIITHDNFRDQAERLKAHKESADTLSVLVTDIQDVYNEFSWGLYDPAAIRDFMKTAVETWAVPPSYLLLFGDGDYDYRNILSDEDQNWIPPYEANGYEDKARAMDDWYTYVPDADAQRDHVMAMAVGRIPVRTGDEAEIVVEKIIQYESEPERSVWRNLITLVSDDEIKPGFQNEWTHLDASLDLADEIMESPYNLKPIFETEYATESTTEGPRKPKATEALIDQINRGTLVVNYIGHGNEDLWSDEWVFQRDRDIPDLFNADRLPVFYAATCRFGWYDHVQKTSFAEELVVSEGKGAIAVIAASRDCIPDYNERLNKECISLMLSSTDQIRIGDALRAAKTAYSTQYTNNQKYHILGDPTLVIGSPRESLRITAMNPDTLSALGTVTVEGIVLQGDGPRTDFNGHVTLQVFDAEKRSTYKSKTYTLPGNTLFRGDAAVEAGRFESAFIVPKDISYGSNTGRISLYAWSDETDGSGFRNDISIGGSSEVEDDEGPRIHLAFSDQEAFLSGGMVSGMPELLATVSDDKTGVNITGDIGHKLMLTLNDENLDVTEYFKYDEGSYLKGKIAYPMSNLKQQQYTLALKAWDNANNSSTSAIEFEYVSSDRIRMEEVLNYPNPMRGSTHFTFRINRDAEVDIKIYTVSGREIRHLSGYLAVPGFNMIAWDGRDVVGDALANGIYLYKVIASAYEGGRRIESSEIGRLMVMR